MQRLRLSREAGERPASLPCWGSRPCARAPAARPRPGLPELSTSAGGGLVPFVSVADIGAKRKKQENVSHLYHFLDNFGLPLTVLCHTTGKLVLLAKFWVMAMVVSRLRTTCHQPPETQQAKSSVGPGSGDSHCDTNFAQRLTGTSEAGGS